MLTVNHNYERIAITVVIISYVHYARTMTSMDENAGAMTFNAAVGFTINQYMFATSLTRVALGDILGCSGPNISNRLRGKIGWPAEDLAIMADLFGVSVQDLYPQPDGQGGWIPAPFVPGHAKTPAGAGVLDRSHLRESNSRPIHYE